MQLRFENMKWGLKYDVIACLYFIWNDLSLKQQIRDNMLLLCHCNDVMCN